MTRPRRHTRWNRDGGAWEGEISLPSNGFPRNRRTEISSPGEGAAEPGWIQISAPPVGHELAALLKRSLDEATVSAVVSPALGGVVIGHEVARALGCRGIFTERVAGKMTLRRGFEIARDERIVVVEDVTTTGGSIREVVEVVKEHGGRPAAVGLIVNRAGNLDFEVPLVYLVKADIANHRPEVCPLCKKGVPVVKPGTKRTQMERRT